MKQIDPRGENLRNALVKLPLLGDDLYLRMQAMNLGVVDNFLMDAERQLLVEYIDSERTPFGSAIFVTALTQLWIFGVYELLRTWRQRVREVVTFAESMSKLPAAKRVGEMKKKEAELRAASSSITGAGERRWRAFKKACDDPAFIEELFAAEDTLARIFRKLEILRIHLAKHEQHKSKGSMALAPGYGRIHNDTGAIYFQVTLPGNALPNEVDVISRRDIADGCRELVNDKTDRIVPRAMRGQLKGIPECSYGVKRIKATLKDGSERRGVYVYGDVEIVGMANGQQMFDAKNIVRLVHDPDKARGKK